MAEEIDVDAATEEKLVDVLPDRVDTRAPDYLGNRDGLTAQLTAISEQLAQANGGGGEKYVARHRKRGKLLVRERIELMLDPDTAFLELCPFAAWGTKVLGRWECRRGDRRRR